MKKKSRKINKYIPFLVVGVISIVAIVWALVIFSGSDLDYENGRLKCDRKDYSSYVKTTKTTTPGNEEINKQLDTVKKAMDLASEADDALAFGQLYEEYNRLLALQASTSTESETTDDSEAITMKKRCYTSVKNEKDMDSHKATWILACGFVAGIATVVVFVFVNRKKTKKR